MDAMLAVAFLGDIQIRIENRKEQAEHQDKFFKRIKDFGFKVNDTKCEFFITGIKYLGQIIDANGRRPDNEKCFALKNFPPPINVSTLQAFLGLVSYFSIYVPNINKWRAPLNNLLKDVKWNW